MGITRRAMLFAAGAATAGAAITSLRSGGTGGAILPAPDSGGTDVLNDASGLSPVRVARHVTIGAGDEAARVTQVRAELADARAAGRPLIASAARHSMGAQSLCPNGTALTLDETRIAIDEGARIYRAAAGLRWRDVIGQLDARGWSPMVMQSNNDFGVASTFCVNAHGWPVAHGPFGSTVRALRIMLADGEIVECSRTLEPDLFQATMGGYGLLGVILDLDVEMAPNVRLEPRFEVMATAEFGQRFAAAAVDPQVDMAYGRLDVSLGSFFEEALMITYRPTADQTSLPPASGSGLLSHVSRQIFRAQLGSDPIKHLRWGVETRLAPQLAGSATRNSLLNEPVVTLADGDETRTDILHEYFIAPERFSDFVAVCRDVIPSSFQDLLNVTLRYVAADPDSLLNYAPVPRIAAVMLFSQEMTVRAEADMARMTQGLIEGVLAIGGSYYLPYRPHATRGQFERAYPRHADFTERKRRYDPDGLFVSPFWTRYLSEGASGT